MNKIIEYFTLESTYAMYCPVRVELHFECLPNRDQHQIGASSGQVNRLQLDEEHTGGLYSTLYAKTSTTQWTISVHPTSRYTIKKAGMRDSALQVVSRHTGTIAKRDEKAITTM